MGKEILAIPEENLQEVIKVIRAGLYHPHLPKITSEVFENLIEWCNEMEDSHGV